MTAKTNAGLVQWCVDHLGTPYVYGMKMAILTQVLFYQLQEQYGKAIVWDSDARKIGKICCDCSGLISSYTGIPRGSAQFNDTAESVNPISTISSAPIGSLVWKAGHIGVFVGIESSNPMYIAADGSGVGCRKGMLPGVFTHWFLCTDITYTAPVLIKSPEEVTVDNAFTEGVLVDKAYWLGVLTGKFTANPTFLKTVLDRYHEKTK